MKAHGHPILRRTFGPFVIRYIAFHWTPMSTTAIILTVIIGLIATAGHLFLIKALTLGEASLVAPFGYTSLLRCGGIILFNNYPDFGQYLGLS